MRRWVVLSALALASLSWGDVWYKVTAEPGAKGLQVQITFDAPKGDTDLQIPRWSPGSYSYGNYAARVKDVGVVDAHGSPLVVAKAGETTWRTKVGSPQRISVSYTIDGPVGKSVHFSGPSTYMYLVGRKTEPCHVQVVCPGSWGVYTGLNPDTGKNAFYAPTYDVLADNPVSAGDLPVDTYLCGGVPHFIVYHSGPVEKLNRALARKTLEQISQFDLKFWGRFPFDKYVWHVSVMDSPAGGWGLEHLSSTEVGMATGFSTSTKSVMAHEYWHAWNVKRIRSFVLGPFDYQHLPKTGALWWLEGVTDYYASVVLARSGIATPEYLQQQAAVQTANARRNPDRLKSTIYDASYTLDEANGGRGSSTGNKLDYYTFGWLAGMCFDLQLRNMSDGQTTLDDVIKDLFAECNGKPGFPEDGIRKALVKRGGPELGTLYDKWIMTPGELPVEAQLAKVGVKLSEVTRSVPSMPYLASVDRADGPVTVQDVRDGAGDLKKGDQILKVDGKVVPTGFRGFRAANQLPTDAKKGDQIDLVVKRGDQELTVKVTVTGRDVSNFGAVQDPSATDRQKRLWAAWCGAN